MDGHIDGDVEIVIDAITVALIFGNERKRFFATLDGDGAEFRIIEKFLVGHLGLC